MNDIRVHAVESINLVSQDGLEKLIRILQSSGEAHQVVVLAPFTDVNLELNNLLHVAMQRDERLWSMQEQRFTRWTALVEDLLAVPAGTKVLDRIKQGFADMEDILRSIWLVQEISEGAKRYAGALCDSWVADIACHWANLHDLSSNLLGYADSQKKHSVEEAVLFVYGAVKDGQSEYAAAPLLPSLEQLGLPSGTTAPCFIMLTIEKSLLLWSSALFPMQRQPSSASSVLPSFTPMHSFLPLQPPWMCNFAVGKRSRIQGLSSASTETR